MCQSCFTGNDGTGEGHIITISSVVAEKLHHEPFTGLAYDVSKAAINRFTTGLADELKPHKELQLTHLLPTTQ